MLIERTVSKYIILVFGMVFLRVASSTATQKSKTYNLSNYMKQYLLVNEKVKTAELSLNSAKEDLQISEDLYQSDLILTAEQTHVDQSFSPSGLSLYERNTLVKGDLSQKLALGTELTFSVSDTIDDSDNVIGRVDRAVSFSLSQPLLKNSFGKFSQLKIEKAKLEVKLLEQTFLQNRIEQCSVGAELFIKSFVLQEKFSLLIDLEKSSEKLKKSADQDYQNKLLKKIDWLSAQADFLDIQTKRIEAGQEFSNKSASLFVWANESSKKVKLESPSSVFDLEPSTLIWRDNKNITLLSLSQKLSRDEKAAEIAERESSSELDFSLELGQRKGQTLVSSSLESFEDNFINLSLTWSLPVHNNTLKAGITKAIYNKEKTRLETLIKQKELQNQWFSFLNNLKANLEKLKNSKKKIEFYKEQMIETERLVKAGKFEIEQFLNFRDKYLNQKLEELSLRQEVWLSQLKVSELNGQMPIFCKADK